MYNICINLFICTLAPSKQTRTIFHPPSFYQQRQVLFLCLNGQHWATGMRNDDTSRLFPQFSQVSGSYCLVAPSTKHPRVGTTSLGNTYNTRSNFFSKHYYHVPGTILSTEENHNTTYISFMSVQENMNK